MHLLPLSIFILLYSILSQVHKTGLIAYLPSKLQEFFLEISIFDVLCHIWFVPNISLYIHSIFLPFFVEMTREEAYSMFFELNPNVAKALDTKGLVNILPDPVVKVIMPEEFTKVKKERVEDLRLLSFNENQARILKPKTVLLGSGSRSHAENSRLGQGINDITKKIPTLEPFFGKILGHRFRLLMAKVSPSVLGMIALLAGGGVLMQIFVSRYARKWVANTIKLSCLSGSLMLLVCSILALGIKLIHNQIEEPRIESQQEGPKAFRGMKKIKSRFNSKADRNYFFNPDLKMAS